MGIQQTSGFDRSRVSLLRFLMRGIEQGCIENFFGDRDEIGMRDPGAIEAYESFPLLVFGDLCAAR